MWWFCFKPSKTADLYEDEIVRYNILEDKLLALGIQESLNQQDSSQKEKEEKTRDLESSLEYDEDAQLAEAVKKSLKDEVERKQREDEQVKKDGQMAQDLQNRLETEERTRLLHDESVLENDEDLAKAIEKSLEEKGKRKQFEEEQAKKDERLAKTVEKSLQEKGKGKQTKDELEEDEKHPNVIPPPSICGGCNFEIELERSVDISGVLWHPECLLCDACDKPIAIENHVSNSRGKFHKSCYDRYCYVCKGKMRRYNQHHFWKERYCCSHESDGTPKCCSCERLEPRGTNYVMLGDTRWLCLECMESAVMDSDECQPLHFDIREFFEGLNMKIEKQFPFLLVERDALNKAEKEEKIDYQYELVTRGICLSEARTVMSVSRARRTRPSKQLIIETDKEPLKVSSRDDSCEVTAILILYGLPRLLTGYILAHEMMHAYLRLNGHRKLNKVNEEGICQVLGHMWLESQRYSPIDDPAASSSSSASALSHTASSKKGDQSEFEKKLVEFCINQIETDESRVYGDGFRKVNEMVTSSTLQETLKEILRLG